MSNEVKNNTLIIFRLLRPLIFKNSNSFLLNISIKKNWDEIKNIKGKISKIIVGVFIIDNKKGNKKLTFKSLKKEISSNIFRIKIKDKKRAEIFTIFLKNTLAKYNSYFFIILVISLQSL